MIPEALEEKIVQCKREGLHPFFVSATAGTTVYGAFDPLPKIADICERHKIWFHVDVGFLTVELLLLLHGDCVVKI